MTGSQTTNPKSVLHRLYTWFISAKVGVFLLLILGGISMVGMFIIQNAPQEQYQLKYGELWGLLIMRLGIAHVYRSWWYQSILFLATVNLLLCSIKRIPNTMRQVFGSLKADSAELLRNAEEHELLRPKNEVVEQLKSILHRKQFHFTTNALASPTIFSCRKGAISRLGYLVIHGSILMIIIAGAMNTWTGVRTLRPLEIGESLDVSTIRSDARFTVRVDDFAIETNEEGMIRDYKSTLTVLENDRELYTRIIEVNKPLVHQGISFYQSSYGQVPNRIKSAILTRRSPENRALQTIEAPFEQNVPLQTPDEAIRIVRYVPYFVKDLETGEVYSRSDQPRLPAIQVQFFKNQEVLESAWLIRGMDSHGVKGALSNFSFENYIPYYYTGLEIADNPGIPFLLASFGLASVGFILAFFIPHKLLWIGVWEEGDSRSRLRITGSSRNAPHTLKREIDAIYTVVNRLPTDSTGKTP